MQIIEYLIWPNGCDLLKTVCSSSLCKFIFLF